MPRAFVDDTHIRWCRPEMRGNGGSARRGRGKVAPALLGVGGVAELKAKVPVISDRDFSYGGGTGTRTPNPLLAKQVRYQLRHAPIRSNPSIIPHVQAGIYQLRPGSSASRPCRLTCSRHPSGLRIPVPFYRPGDLRLPLLKLPATSSQAPHSGSVLPEPLSVPWAYQDLNLGPLRYQRSALTA